jgi:hypothetical protein
VEVVVGGVATSVALGTDGSAYSMLVSQLDLEW